MNTRSGRFSRRTMLRRSGQLGLGLGALGVANALASCASQEVVDEPMAEAGAPITGQLRVATYASADQQPAYEKLYSMFHEKYPDVALDVRFVSATSWTEFFDAVSVQIAGGEIPDVLRMAIEGTRTFIDRDLLLPLDPYIERDSNELADFFDDVHPTLLKATREVMPPDGHTTYYLPAGYNLQVMWCNTEMYRGAGVEVPDDSWTWDDHNNAARTITRATGKYGSWMTPAYFNGLMPWALSNGTSVMNQDWTRVTIDTPEMLESVEQMVSMVEEGISPVPGGQFDYFASMAANELATFGRTRSGLIGCRDFNMVDKVKTVAFPGNPTSGTPVGVLGFPILRASPNKEAAWAFAKTMASKEANDVIARETPIFMPARTSSVMSEAYSQDSPENIGAMHRALDTATLVPSPVGTTLMEQSIINFMNEVLTGNVGPREGLQRLQSEVEEQVL